MMKNFILISTAALFLSGCMSSEKKENSETDTFLAIDSTSPICTDTILLEDTIPDSNDSITENEDEEENLTDNFIEKIPNARELLKTKNITKYLHSLGFSGKMKTEGGEEDTHSDGTFTLKSGDKSCIVKAHNDIFYESYEVTIKGDKEAESKFFSEAKSLSKDEYGNEIRALKKNGKIIIELDAGAGFEY